MKIPMAGTGGSPPFVFVYRPGIWRLPAIRFIRNFSTRNALCPRSNQPTAELERPPEHCEAVGSIRFSVATNIELGLGLPNNSLSTLRSASCGFHTLRPHERTSRRPHRNLIAGSAPMPPTSSATVEIARWCVPTQCGLGFASLLRLCFSHGIRIGQPRVRRCGPTCNGRSVCIDARSLGNNDR